MKKNIRISIVIPVMNEEENILSMADEIERVMAGMSHSWECIWVDDGSTDKTFELLQTIEKKGCGHEYIRLVRNFGQSAALMTGFRKASGEYILTLDGDGQNEISDIPPLVDFCLKNNADMVNGYRLVREDSWVRILSSRIGNGVRNILTQDSIRDVGCSLRIFKALCIQDVFLFKGMHRFLPTLIRLNGFESIYEIGVHHKPRTRGISKYGVANRLWVGLWDSLAVRWIRARKVSPQLQETSINKIV